MLENKVIIYDDSCPMCKLYTYWFVAWGFMVAFAIVGLVVATALSVTSGATATWDYIGNHATSLLIVALMLTPMLVWPTMPAGTAWVNVLTAALLGLEEMRRRS